MVKQYLLDTNVLSDIVRNMPRVNDRFLNCRRESLVVSVVTLKEIEYGRWWRPEGARRFNVAMDILLAEIEPIPFGRVEALNTGRLRATLARAGTPIGPFDVMIAGTALTHGLTLVTANTRELSQVPGLALEDWRAPCEVRERSLAHVYRAASGGLRVRGNAAFQKAAEIGAR